MPIFGATDKVDCIRFNGGNVSEMNKQLANATKIGVIDYGLSVSFLVPDQVG